MTPAERAGTKRFLGTDGGPHRLVRSRVGDARCRAEGSPVRVRTAICRRTAPGNCRTARAEVRLRAPCPCPAPVLCDCRRHSGRRSGFMAPQTFQTHSLMVTSWRFAKQYASIEISPDLYLRTLAILICSSKPLPPTGYHRQPWTRSQRH